MFSWFRGGKKQPEAGGGKYEQPVAETRIPLHIISGNSISEARQVQRGCVQRLCDEFRGLYVEFAGNRVDIFSEVLVEAMNSAAGLDDRTGGIICYCPMLDTEAVDESSGLISIESINSGILAVSSMSHLVERGCRIALTDEQGGGGSNSQQAGGGYSPVDDLGGSSFHVSVVPIPATRLYAAYEPIREAFLNRMQVPSRSLIIGGDDEEGEAEEMGSLPPSCVSANELRKLKRRPETLNALKAIALNIVRSGGGEDRFLRLLAGSGKFEEVITRFEPANATLQYLGYGALDGEGVRRLDPEDATDLVPECERTVRFIEYLTQRNSTK